MTLVLKCECGICTKIPKMKLLYQKLHIPDTHTDTHKATNNMKTLLSSILRFSTLIIKDGQKKRLIQYVTDEPQLVLHQLIG